MAITALTAVGGITGSIAFTDESNRSSSSEITMPAATTLAQAQAFMLALAQAAETLSDAQVRRVSITASYDPTGADPAVKGNTVEEKASFGIKTAVGKTAHFSVPAINITYQQNGTRTVDLANADITSLTNLLVTGDGTVAPVDTNAQDLVQILYGRVRKRADSGP
jgi:hypothetical protein